MYRIASVGAACIVAAGLALGAGLRAQAPVTLVNEATPGATGTVLVPDGVCFVRIQAAGGSGGNGASLGSPSSGGSGALIGARIAVTPISGATVTYSITDGGEGDDDLAPNGTIEDPAGPGAAATPVPMVPVVLLAALILLLIGAGSIVLRRGAVVPAVSKGRW